MRWLSRRITTPVGLLIAVLVSFALVAACGIACGELLSLAERPGGSTAFDSSITSWAVRHRTSALTALARAFATLGSQVVLAPVVGILTLGLLARRRVAQAGLLIAAWGGALGLYSVIKAFVQRPRPPARIWLTNVGHTSSFPSGHATQSLATFTAVVLVAAVWVRPARWPLRALALLLALGVGWSRIYLGVHWATDVLAGWLIAAAWVLLVAWCAHPGRLIAEPLLTNQAVQQHQP